jgi:predicted transport protein
MKAKPKANAAAPVPATSWKCPMCRRAFNRKNQRHACGTGDRSQVLRDRPPSLVRLYEAVEAFAKSLGPIEIVARERYVLLRSTRIFADLVIMADAVRIAIHLARELDDPIFFKVVRDQKKVTHVAKLRSENDFSKVRSYLKEAYTLSVAGR